MGIVTALCINQNFKMILPRSFREQIGGRNIELVTYSSSDASFLGPKALKSPRSSFRCLAGQILMTSSLFVVENIREGVMLSVIQKSCM